MLCMLDMLSLLSMLSGKLNGVDLKFISFNRLH